VEVSKYFLIKVFEKTKLEFSKDFSETGVLSGLQRTQLRKKFKYLFSKDRKGLPKTTMLREG
jgi:hypothetical protein